MIRIISEFLRIFRILACLRAIEIEPDLRSALVTREDVFEVLLHGKLRRELIDVFLFQEMHNLRFVFEMLQDIIDRCNQNLGIIRLARHRIALTLDQASRVVVNPEDRLKALILSKDLALAKHEFLYLLLTIAKMVLPRLELL